MGLPIVTAKRGTRFIVEYRNDWSIRAAEQNSLHGFRWGRVSPTTWRAAPSLRAGRLIDSMLPLRKRVEAFRPLYIYIWAAAGGIWALRREFQSPVVIQVFEMFTKAITESNYFRHG